MAENFDERLDNWGRYYRSRTQTVTGSLGRLYKAPWRQWVSYLDLPLFKALDWRDAELIESHWRQMQDLPKELLKLTYMAKVSKSVLCRRCEIKPWEHTEELRRAKYILECAVTNGKSVLALRHCQTAQARISPTEANFARLNKVA